MAWHRQVARTRPCKRTIMESVPDRVLSRPKDPCALPCYESCCKRPIRQGIHHGPNPGIVRGEHQIRNGRQIAPLHGRTLTSHHMYARRMCQSSHGMKCPGQQRSFSTYNKWQDSQARDRGGPHVAEVQQEKAPLPLGEGVNPPGEADG